MLTFPAPAALHGDNLTAELKAAGLPVTRVWLDDQTLHIDGTEDRPAVQRVLAAHVPPPSPADPVNEFRKAVEAATTLASLKAALLGNTGPGAQPRNR